MWTLIWVIAATNGGVSSGATAFPSQAACEAARTEVLAMAEAATTGSPYQSRRETRCLEQESGRAAAHPEPPGTYRRFNN